MIFKPISSSLLHRFRVISFLGACSFLALGALQFGACSETPTPPGSDNPTKPVDTLPSPIIDSSDTSLACQAICSATAPSIPAITPAGGSGNVTTYGSVSNPEASQGGACNYGSTGVKRYAAISVNLTPGDDKGFWQGGRACGACARVWAANATGIATTVVRIMDKCPDAYCGIDLGGLPAHDLMGSQAGRYVGKWEWIPCEDAELFDGPTSLHIKTGSNAWWSLIQVRNGLGAVSAMRIKRQGDSQWTSLTWAIEAENFWSVPAVALQDEGLYEIEAEWKMGGQAQWLLKGSQLSVEDADYPVTP